MTPTSQQWPWAFFRLQPKHMHNRLTLFDGQSIKSKDLSGWSADEWHTVFGSYFGHDDVSPRSLYSVVGWLYACVNLRADRVSAMPWAIFKGENKVLSDEDDLTDYPFLDNLTDLLELTESALCILGYAYWFKARNLRNQPLGLRWFAPDTMQVIYDRNQGIAGFRRLLDPTRTMQAGIDFTPDDIVYFRLSNALSELEPGTPPAQAAMADASVLHNMNDFKNSFFARGAIKATMLSMDENIDPDEAKKVEAWYKRFFSGIKQAWSTATIIGKVEAIVVGEGLESLSNSELTLESRQAIATALGVPDSIISANAANFATAQQDEINFLSNCIIPESRLIERTLNRQLFAATGLRFKFEPERLSAMQEDEEQRASSYATYVNAKIRPSIAAQLVGLNLPDGVTFEMLDADLAAEQELQRQQTEAQIARLNAPQQGQIAERSSARDEEVRRLKRWAKGKKSPDVDAFHSHVLEREEKMLALGIQEDAGAEDAPFPASDTQWSHYP
jgi:HK97 family phage portal protein